MSKSYRVSGLVQQLIIWKVINTVIYGFRISQYLENSSGLKYFTKNNLLSFYPFVFVSVSGVL